MDVRAHDCGFAPGDSIGGYRVVAPLGRGGSGEVYLVEAPGGRDRFALKILSRETEEKDPEFAVRFVREAEFAMRTRHPNIVEVYDAKRDDATGLPFLVMEYMPLGSLRAALDAEPNGLPMESVVAVASDVSRALAFIEANGMVHRDVKPDNILFASDGSAKLADLGVSRFAPSQGGDSRRVTASGEVVGTPAYMAPEQMLDSHKVDARADVYALGVVMYEMLAGRRPNEGDGALRILAKAIDGRSFPDVRTHRPDTPQLLAELVADMTSPDPERRPPSARFVHVAVSKPLGGSRSAATNQLADESRRVEDNAPYQAAARRVEGNAPYQAAARRVEDNAPYQAAARRVEDNAPYQPAPRRVEDNAPYQAAARRVEDAAPYQPAARRVEGNAPYQCRAACGAVSPRPRIDSNTVCAIAALALSVFVLTLAVLKTFGGR